MNKQTKENENNFFFFGFREINLSLDKFWWSTMFPQTNKKHEN